MFVKDPLYAPYQKKMNGLGVTLLDMAKVNAHLGCNGIYLTFRTY